MSDSLIPKPSQIAASIFSTGPNDLLAAVDAYETSPAEVINNLAGLLSGFDSSILDNVATGIELFDELTGAVNPQQLPFRVDTGAMTERVAMTNNLGGNRGLLATVTASILASLVSGQGLNPVTANSVQMSVNNVTYGVDNQDPRTIVAFSNLINTLVGGQGLGTVVDEGAQTSLLTGVLTTCMALGLSGLIPGVLSSSLGTISAVATIGALLNIIPMALDNCDLLALAAILGIALGAGYPTGGVVIFTAAPDACQIILKKYTMPSRNHSPVFYNPWANQLVAVLTGINPNWDKLNRNGVWVSNLEALVGCSADARTVLATIEQYLVMATIASDYVERDPIVSAKRLIPNVSFVPNSRPSDYGTYYGMGFSLSGLPALTFANN